MQIYLKQIKTKQSEAKSSLSLLAVKGIADFKQRLDDYRFSRLAIGREARKCGLGGFPHEQLS